MKLIIIRNIKYKLKTMWIKFNCKMYYGNQVHFGKRFCSRGNINICIDEDGRIDIGDNVHIYDHNHNYKDRTRLIKGQGFSKGAVIYSDGKVVVDVE